ncbi:hypothetical protein QBC37DRAFT_42808 [Rhypophila decipiens]|uniref:Uncharacterized protein n=1 Tax=Rhypophila decipiens TaxID=261697 RepID=A0AAN6Y2G3_9PEZI|nr:hypothetical protein QBC37DRAFT_42808 [Rhypophila decipiens]
MKSSSISRLIISSLLYPVSVSANTEKTIFLGPETVRVPAQHPTIHDLHLDVLTPRENKWSLRTSLPRQFPNSTHPVGLATWFLLDELTQGQRYEVRVCWAATQPTSFTINTYPLDLVFSTPDLITSLNEYSLLRLNQASSSQADDQPPASTTEKEKESSLLFLQISSAADYFTTNKSLMSNPPPVDVDIILDPFLLNLLPRSLVPTVIYIILVSILAYFVSSRVLSYLDNALGLGKPTITTVAEENKKTN